MQILDTGLWIILVTIATVFTFVSFKIPGSGKIAFHILAVALWMGLAMIHGGGTEVSAYTNSTWVDSSGMQFNNTSYDRFIPGGETAYWLGYLFMGFGILNLLFIFSELMKMGVVRT